MTQRPERPERLSELRQCAEQALELDPGNAQPLSSEETASLIHDLRVHQVELEMQNEELHRVGQELEAARDRYVALYDFAPVGYFTLSDKNLILEANLTGATLLGVARRALIGKAFSRFVSREDEDLFYLYRKELLASPDSKRCELRVEKSDGSRFFARLESILEESSESSGRWKMIVSDITEQKAAEEAMIEAKEAAEAGNRAKSEFLSVMSHEMRTPLQGIIGMAEILEEDWMAGDQQKCVEIIKSSSRALLDLINDTLDLAETGAGDFQLERTAFSLTEVIDGVISLLAVRAREKGLSFVRNIDSGIPETLLGDRKRLRQILLNLMGNAVKFTDFGTVTIQTEVDGMDDERIYLSITVRDTGIGISPDQQDSIFTPFVQLDTSNTRSHGGTGLGLAICKRFAQLMGGRIEVRSAPAQGSAFRVILPFRRSLDVNSGIDTPPALSDPNRLPSSRILVVEDNRVNQILVKGFLGRLGQSVEVANNGREALNRFDEADFDLILMDCLMPVMDGFSAARAWRKKEQQLPKGRHTPIVAFTALSTKQDREKCLAAGMDDYLAKPIGARDLERMLRHWLRVDETPMGPTAAKPAVDASTLERLREEMGEDFSEIVAVFFEVLPDQMNVLRQAVDRKESEPLHIETHSLKSSCRQLGLDVLADLVMELDVLGRSGKWKKAATVFLQAEQEASRALAFIETTASSIEARPE